MNQREKEKRTKFLRLLKDDGDPIYQGRPNDIIIPVMGPTGSGKSTFINSLLAEDQPKLEVGHGLQACTRSLFPVEIALPESAYSFPLNSEGNSIRLILVDTPGFDDTIVDDSEILRLISVWLASSYNQEMKLGGVIYLHDISHARLTGSTLRNLDLFQRMVGSDAFQVVTLATTKWNLVNPSNAEQRHSELRETFWGEMHRAGSRICRLRNLDESPREMIDAILRRAETTLLTTPFLKIQEELVTQKKFIPETEAGKLLKRSLEGLIALQQRRIQNLGRLLETERSADRLQQLQKEFMKGQEQLCNLLKAASNMKVPVSERVKRFFI